MLKLVALTLLGVAVCHAAILGGYTKAAKDDPDVLDVMSFVERSMNAQSNDMYRSRLTDVFDVQKQVVNGFNYKIEFEFSRTSCSKMSMIALKTCPTSGKVERCTAKVYRPLAGEMEMNGFMCKPTKAQKRRAGGISGPVDNPELFRDEAAKAISLSNSELDATKGFKVVEVRTQVVSGLKTFMKIQGQVNGVLSVCDFTIWSRPWLSDEEGYQVSAEKCRPVKSEKKPEGKMCAGCIQDEEAVDEDTQALFKQALSVYDDETLTSTIDLAKTKFISMQKQVVAGIKYIIKLETMSEGKTHKCEVTFVSTPWLTPANVITDYTCE